MSLEALETLSYTVQVLWIMYSHTLHLCSYLKYTRLLYSSVFQLLRTNRPGPWCSISITTSCFGIQVNKCFDKTHVYTHAHTHANKLTRTISPQSLCHYRKRMNASWRYCSTSQPRVILSWSIRRLLWSYATCGLWMTSLLLLSVRCMRDRAYAWFMHVHSYVRIYFHTHIHTHTCGYIHPHNAPRTMKYMCVRVYT